MTNDAQHSGEPHGVGLAGRLNRLRAAVLGATLGLAFTYGVGHLFGTAVG